jgi:anti-sigma factor RsiW
MNCEQIQPKLLDLSRGRLSAFDKKETKEHLAGCPACRALLAEEEALDHRLMDLPVAVPRTDLWPLVRSSVRRHEPVMARLRSVFGAPRRALAAGLAVAAAAAVIIVTSPARQPQVTKTETHAVLVYQSAQPTAAWDDPMGDNTERVLAAIKEGT